jgi:phage recombination protein Bet
MTTAAVVKTNGHGDLITFDSEKLALIKRTVLKPKNRAATDDELALFAHQCQRTGLDPLARQIYGVYRYDKRAGQEVMGIQTGIDGFRAIAQRSGRYLGQTPVFWADENLNWTEVWTKPGPPVAAKVGVYMKGREEPTWATAKFRSYNAGGPMWDRMPDLMIGKCAEALALRKAFPAELSGLYIPEEMEQSEVEHRPEPPAPETAMVEAEVVEGLDPERVDALRTGLKALGLNIGEVANLFGAAGLDGLRARSKKAIEERLMALTDSEADALEAEMNRQADNG